jgi:hypothetical protein
VSILDGTSPLPSELCPAEPDAPRPTAQWLAHHNAIFDLAWCQVRRRSPDVSGCAAPMVPCTASAERDTYALSRYTAGSYLHSHQSLDFTLPNVLACAT